MPRVPPLMLQATLQESFSQLQQQSFTQLKLTLNSFKTKTTPPPALKITIHKQFTAYKYLGIWLETSLSFSIHISKLQLSPSLVSLTETTFCSPIQT